MNDFTKEELIEIVDYLNWEPDSVGFSDFRKHIYKKIQSMIDNYCEPKNYNPDCYCGQVAYDKSIITDCGYPPHRKIDNDNQ